LLCRRIPVLLLLIASAAPSIAVKAASALVDGSNDRPDPDKGFKPVASICARPSEIHADIGDVDPAMAYVYGNGKRTKCSSSTSKIRVDYPMQPGTDVSFHLYQPGCRKVFPKGEEIFKMSTISMSSTLGTAFIEFYVVRGAVAETSPVDFCLAATQKKKKDPGEILKGNRDTLRTETNVSVGLSYRVTAYNHSRGKPANRSAVYAVVESLSLNEADPTSPTATWSSPPTERHRRNIQSSKDEL
jgi:hypothetical protein